MNGDELRSEADLVSVAVALGADSVSGWSATESKLAKRASVVSGKTLKLIRQRIADGEDPLGDAFCKIRQPAERRTQGATYTPQPIVDAMVSWAAEFDKPARIIDPGIGSGRYLLTAGRRFPKSQLIGVEVDPLAAVLARANLAAAGLGDRAEVILGDFRSAVLPGAGKTLFIGNPPYVRHHLLDAHWKSWLIHEATHRGHSASQLAGLHVHFF